MAHRDPFLFIILAIITSLNIEKKIPRIYLFKLRDFSILRSQRAKTTMITLFWLSMYKVDFDHTINMQMERSKRYHILMLGGGEIMFIITMFWWREGGDNIYHCIKERYWYRPYGGIKMIFILTFFLMKGGGGEGYWWSSSVSYSLHKRQQGQVFY